MTGLADYYEDILLALLIWREARGELPEARAGVLHVVLNRAADLARRWPSTRARVILAANQFSSFSAGDPNAAKFPFPWDVPWIECCRVVEHPPPDPTSGANMYHSGAWEALSDRSKRDFPQDKITARIGAFTFYKV